MTTGQAAPKGCRIHRSSAEKLHQNFSKTSAAAQTCIFQWVKQAGPHQRAAEFTGTVQNNFNKFSATLQQNFRKTSAKLQQNFSRGPDMDFPVDETGQAAPTGSQIHRSSTEQLQRNFSKTSAELQRSFSKTAAGAQTCISQSIKHVWPH